MNGSPTGLPIGITGNFKILLLILAVLFIIGMLVYSGQLTDQLLQRERTVVALYARSIEFISSSSTIEGDVSFAFEVIQAIDFPIVYTDSSNHRIYSKNLDLDTLTLSPPARDIFFRDLLVEMDQKNVPIRVYSPDSLVLGVVHYGESALIRRLRWLPVIELFIAFVLVVFAYLGFNTIKKSEQGSIWVGMAKETAHQLGTPLSSIMGWLERLRAVVPDTPANVETLSEMERDVERLTKVAARFSKIGSKPDLREEDLAAVIQGVITYIARRLPRGGRTIECVLTTPGVFHARINRELFEWVIENLMKNALDAMEGAPGRIAIAISDHGARLTVDVADSGKGIDPKLHTEIFRPGYSTKKRGWGLGLSLSKRIIEDYHRGKLFVKASAPGEGTTFRIRLRK